MFKPPAHKSGTAGQITIMDLIDDDGGAKCKMGSLGDKKNEGFRPPRYLRDVIKAAQERSSEEFSEQPVHGPLTAAEKRLAGLERALLRLCDGADKRLRNGEPSGWWQTEIRKILQENA